MARYNIVEIDLSPTEVLDRIAAGLPTTSGLEKFSGEFTFTITVDDEVAAEVEAAAERNGVRLVRDDDPALRLVEPVEFPGSDTVSPDP